MKRGYSKEQLHKKKCRIVAGFLVSLVLLCLSGRVLYAKYYAGRSEKGVATASSLYFSSNFLKDVNESDESSYPAIYNSDYWDGSSAYQFNLKICNYQNQLLYNDRNLDIRYNISFQLAEATDGGTYQVTFQSETKDITSSEAVTFSATLQGGQAMSNLFYISMKSPADNTDQHYRSVGVRVTAKPVSPSYVADYTELGGIFYAGMVSAKYELKGEFSKVGHVGHFAGFPYTITYSPGQDNSVKTIQISWDATKLQLDKYSPYFDTVSTDSEKNVQSLVISIEPYASLDLIFYRADGWDDAVTLSELNQLVKLTGGNE